MSLVFGIGPSDVSRASGGPARLLPVPIVEIDPPRWRASPDEGARRPGAALRLASRAPARPEHAPDDMLPRRAPAGLVFAAQFIAQEILSEGLYLEDFRPAVRAYGMADASLGSLQQPATIAIWA